MRALFTITVFCSAFMLFVIEPIAAKMLLPTFGGSASVWTSAMVFFQLVLLAGYAYANWLCRQAPKKIALIHLCLVCAAIVVLGLSARFGWITDFLNLKSGSSPGPLGVAWALAKLLGLLFFVLAASSPLLQRAFARSKDPLRGNPYFLYAAGNAGSLIALLAYPVVIEPFVSLWIQFAFWAGIINLVFLSAVVCLVAVEPRGKNAAETETEEVDDEPAPTSRQRAKWLILGAAPSSLLLGVTTFLTTTVAPIPLLWVVPLSLYLVTFIVAFANRPRVTASGIGRWLPILATPLALALILESATPIVPIALFHLAVAFCAMLACHLRLSESRPGPRHLTEFFLWMAAGGAVGGLFNALVAPHLFTTLFEYPLALAACCALAVVKAPAGGKPWEPRDWRWPIGIAALTGLLIAAVLLLHIPPSTPRSMIAIGIPLIACFAATGRPIRFGLSLLALFAIASIGHISAGGKVLFTARSFYGVHRVVEDGTLHLRQLVHGNTTHGIQSTLPEKRYEPLTYYSRTGPAGIAFQVLERADRLHRIGLVGLGVGSLAAYGEPGQTMTYFEIDPVVIHVATDPKLFTFLSDSKAKVNIIEGDGRLTLAAEPDHSFDLLVLDAFTSDSIPVHLLTEEALRMYLTKLDDHGILLFHVSNNYLDLGPVLAGEARDLGLVARLYDDTIIGPQELAYGKAASTWMILAKNIDDLGRLARNGNWEPVAKPKRGWTDDRSDLLTALKLGSPPGDDSMPEPVSRKGR